eukprot:IDg2762t1
MPGLTECKNSASEWLFDVRFEIIRLIATHSLCFLVSSKTTMVTYSFEYDGNLNAEGAVRWYGKSRRVCEFLSSSLRLSANVGDLVCYCSEFSNNYTALSKVKGIHRNSFNTIQILVLIRDAGSLAGNAEICSSNTGSSGMEDYPFNCQHCNRQFPSMAALRRHENSVLRATDNINIPRTAEQQQADKFPSILMQRKRMTLASPSSLLSFSWSRPMMNYAERQDTWCDIVVSDDYLSRSTGAFSVNLQGN